MRVKVLGNCQAYYNYGIVVLAEGDEVKGGLALFLLETSADVEPLDGDARAWRPAGDESTEEPEGLADDPADDELSQATTAAEVLEWVGDDPERAVEALEVEQAKDKPRSTLVKQLEKLAEQA